MQWGQEQGSRQDAECDGTAVLTQPRLCAALPSFPFLPQGVNIMAFCKEYNAQTAKMAGDVVPVEITVYEVRAGGIRHTHGPGGS